MMTEACLRDLGSHMLDQLIVGSQWIADPRTRFLLEEDGWQYGCVNRHGKEWIMKRAEAEADLSNRLWSVWLTYSSYNDGRWLWLHTQELNDSSGNNIILRAIVQQRPECMFLSVECCNSYESGGQQNFIRCRTIGLRNQSAGLRVWGRRRLVCSKLGTWGLR